MLLRLFATGHDRLADVDQQALCVKCVDAWRSVADPVALFTEDEEIGKAAVDGYPDAWVSWTVWAAKDPHAERVGLPPLSDFGEVVPAEHPHWATLWIRLWATFPGDATLIGEAVAWLGQPGAGDRRGWAFVWRRLHDLSARPGPVPVDAAILARLGVEWLRGHGDHSLWGRTWEALFRQATDGTLPEDGSAGDVVRLGLDRLGGSEDDHSWSFVWERLVEAAAQDVDPGADGVAELVGRGYRWLDGREDRPDWNFVWQVFPRLWEAGRLPATIDVDEVARKGLEWLPSHRPLAGWAYVWQGLARLRDACGFMADVDYRAFLQEGHAWLRGKEDQPEWSHVWEVLAEHAVAGHLATGVSHSDLLAEGHT